MATRTLLLALSLSSLLVAGCLDGDGEGANLDGQPLGDSAAIGTGAARAADDGVPDDLQIQARGDIIGPFSKTWTWTVEEADAVDYRVALLIGGATGPGVAGGSLADVAIRLTDPSGQVVSEFDSPAAISQWEEAIHFGRGVMRVPAGEWMLTFDSVAGAGSYELFVEGRYFQMAPPNESDPQADGQDDDDGGDDDGHVVRR